MGNLAKMIILQVPVRINEVSRKQRIINKLALISHSPRYFKTMPHADLISIYKIRGPTGGALSSDMLVKQTLDRETLTMDSSSLISQQMGYAFSQPWCLTP